MDLGGMEYMVDAAIEPPQKPGVFRLDAGALRNLLIEIVKVQQQIGDGPNSTLKATTDKLLTEVTYMRDNFSRLEGDLQQMHHVMELASKFNDQLTELRANERIISDSIDLLAVNLQALHDQVEEQLGDESGSMELPQGQMMAELLDRVQVLEFKSSGRKSVRTNTVKESEQTIQGTSGKKRSVIQKRKCTVVGVRSNISTLHRKLSMETAPPPEPKFDMATYFEDLKVAVTEMGMERVASLEDFLTALKNNHSVSPKMLQELMVIFSGLNVDFFSLTVTALNKCHTLTIAALEELVEFLLTSNFDANSLNALFTRLQSPKGHLTLQSFKDLLICLKQATRISTTGLAAFLEIVVSCDGLIDFVEQLKNLESYSWDAFLRISEEIHFSKNKTLQELVEIMDKMSACELRELMCMLLTIPGYINELMYSLPKTPSLSTQKLLETLITLPDNAPKLLSEILELMVDSPELKKRLVTCIGRILDLTASMETERRSMSGFFALLTSVQGMESITLDCIREFLSLTADPNGVSMNAFKCLVQFARDSPHDFVKTLTDMLAALLSCPDVKGEVVVRLLRLMDKAKLFSPAHMKELLDMMENAGMLKQQAFDQLIELFRQSPFNTPYVVNEFITAIHTVDFLTLEDLSHALRVTQDASRRTYEEALERQARREFELNQLRKMSASSTKGQDAIQDEAYRSPGGSIDDDIMKDLQDLKEVQNTILDRLDTLKPAIPEESEALDDVPKDASDETEVSLEPDEPEKESDVAFKDLQKEVKDLQEALNTLLEENNVRARKEAEKKKPRRRATSASTRAKRGTTPTRMPASPASPVSPVPPNTSPEMAHDEASTVTSTEASSITGTRTDQVQDQLLQPEDWQEKVTDKEPVGEVPISESYSQVSCESTTGYLFDELNRLDNIVQQLQISSQVCEHRHQWLEEQMTSKVNNSQMQDLKSAVNKQLHRFANNEIYMGPAGLKRAVAVNCLSCDKKTHSTKEPVEKSIPQKGVFPPVYSQRPHNIYEMDLVRRQARSLLEGKTNLNDTYSLPRSCGGHHTSVNVRHTWTYEIHKESGHMKGMDGRIYGGALAAPSKDVKVEITASPLFTKTGPLFAPHAPNQPRP